MDRTERSFRLDALWVGLYCLVLFGFAAFSGRPLTMHEARLPETSREMLHNHEWLLPTSGGRPWLERPPLPHWLVISAMKIFGHDDRVWIVRLPSALMGLLTVLLTLYIARIWFSPTVGILSACLLATSYKFYQYACLAEDDIFLAALVALTATLFTFAENRETNNRLRHWWSVFTLRSPAILGFFFGLGLSNWAKGPLLGLIILGTPVGIYLCWQSWISRSWQPLLRYTWMWGWLLLIALTLLWPWWAKHRYPDVVDNWKYDYIGRFSGTYTAINEPSWYYPPKLLVGLLPWTPVCLYGMVLALYVVLKGKQREPITSPLTPISPNGSGKGTLDYFPPRDKPIGLFQKLANHFQRTTDEMTPRRNGHAWVLCWAIIPLLVLSIPHGKHDHYLVPFLSPWAMLGAIGLINVVRVLTARRLSVLPNQDTSPDRRIVQCDTGFQPVPELSMGITAKSGIPDAARTGQRPLSRGRTILVTALVILLIGYCFGMAVFAPGTDHTLDDTAFLLRCRNEVPADAPLFVDGKLGPQGNLDFFRIQFYSRPDATLLHNLSFLRADTIHAPVVYVIARQTDERLLLQLGEVSRIDQSPKSHDFEAPAGRFTLFRLTFTPGMKRYPLPPYINSLQAMERSPGPWCGPEMK